MGKTVTCGGLNLQASASLWTISVVRVKVDKETFKLIFLEYTVNPINGTVFILFH